MSHRGLGLGDNEDEQHERFDVENDFEGGQWIGGEFYFSKKREKRQQTKDDVLYGVFAEGSDSDEDRPRKRERADYTKPVSFVSKGVVNDKKPEEAQQHEEKADDMEERPSFASMPPAAGLGSSTAPSFRSAGQQNEEEDEEVVLPTAFGARIKARAAERRLEQQVQHKQEKKREATLKADPQLGSFEKFTKGIGMKLLQKMGYKAGEGLGRNKDGIAKPIEAKLRPKGQGMGFGSRHAEEDEEEEKRAAQKKAQAAGPPTKEGAQQAAQQAAAGRMWKKRHAEVRAKREYKTAQEVLSEAPAKPFAAQPILDMRGPQTRVITNLEHLNAQDESAAGTKTPMPELQHNLQLLVDLAEADIAKLDARLRHEQDTATLLAREKERLEEETAHQGQQLQRLALVLNEVAKCQAHATGGASLSDLERSYAHLSASYKEEYVLYNLAAAAVAQVLPRMQALLRGWAPLQEPRRGAAEMARWRPLLESPGARTSGASFSLGTDPSQQDPYLLLVSEVVLPPLRSACLGGWEVRDPEPLLTFLEVWEPLLPPAALSHVLGMLVMPRLRRAVSEWEPRQETVAIHVWLHPWLPFLGSALEELYPSIRHKLGVALQAWHPSDGSALLLLKPWHRVFDSADWEALLLKSIIPKLAVALQQLAINPAQQDMNPFNWVMSWHEVMPAQHLVSLLEVGFFPKWHQVLHYWLSHTPNYDEVTRWYLGWKGCFPSSLADHERMRKQFAIALDMMNSAAEGHVTAAPPQAAAAAAAAVPPVGGAYASRWAAMGDGDAAAGAADAAGVGALPSHWGAPASVELSLKDLVQRYAEEHSIEFVPKFGRYQDGLQVYMFGVTPVVLEHTQSVIRAQIRDGRWAPVTLETLLQQNRGR